MFLGVDLTLSDDFVKSFAQHLRTGRQLHINKKIRIRSTLNELLRSDNVLDANKVRAHWFPEIDCDIFISHSHTDEDKAIALAGWLYDEFSLECFIDSTVWGYADDLLKILDDKFCKNQDGTLYDYNMRNRSTSHVHMMLSTALSMMLDKAECLIFMNTPQSITSENVVKSSQSEITGSPWIYYEIATSRLLERHFNEGRRSRFGRRGVAKAATESLREDLQVAYALDKDHLYKLDELKLLRWSLRQTSSQERYPLDSLYRLLGSEMVK